VSADCQAAGAAREVQRNRWAKWAFSIALIPPTVIGYFVLSFEQYVRITSLVTAVLSITAMSLGWHAAQKGAEAKQAGYENP
jgi:hypothetical protein